MSVTFTRVLVGIAVVVAIGLLVREMPQVLRAEQGAARAPAEEAVRVSPGTMRAQPRSGASDVAHADAPQTVPRDMAQAQAVASPEVSAATPIDIEVSAPGVVSALDPFDASVRIVAPGGVHRLRFAVTYDRKTLELTGVSGGTLAHRADLIADEPSDGNLELTFRVRDGDVLVGEGTVALLHFAPRKSGSVRIAIPALTALDASGAVRFRADAPHAATVEIQ